MVKSWEKYINKSPHKQILNSIIKDILDNNLEKYYIKPLSGYTDLYRIRKGNIRIIFQKKNQSENLIVAVDTRGQIYRWLK